MNAYSTGLSRFLGLMSYSNSILYELVQGKVREFLRKLYFKRTELLSRDQCCNNVVRVLDNGVYDTAATVMDSRKSPPFCTTTVAVAFLVRYGRHPTTAAAFVFWSALSSPIILDPCSLKRIYYTHIGILSIRHRFEYGIEVYNNFIFFVSIIMYLVVKQLLLIRSLWFNRKTLRASTPMSNIIISISLIVKTSMYYILLINFT